MSKPIAFLDADILIHRAVSFVEAEFDGEPVADVQNALYFYDKLLEKWLRDIGKSKISDYVEVITSTKTFRYGLYPDYKANRRDIVPHPALAGLKARVKERLNVIYEDGIEADDLIGIKVTGSEPAIAVSADKDFLTLPCTLFIPASHGKEHGEWHTITKEEADLKVLRQAMTGDTIDNYKGIPRVGPVKAAEIVKDGMTPTQGYHALKAAFATKGFDEEYALTMIRLAHILRDGDFNFETKEVKLWTPEKEPEKWSDALTLAGLRAV